MGSVYSKRVRRVWSPKKLVWSRRSRIQGDRFLVGRRELEGLHDRSLRGQQCPLAWPRPLDDFQPFYYQINLPTHENQHMRFHNVYGLRKHRR